MLTATPPGLFIRTAKSSATKLSSTGMLNIPSEITRMNFKETPEFQKNFKRLRKKYLSLDEDLMEFKKVISLFPIGRSKHLAVLMAMKGIKIFKARLFCRYLKGSSLRIVYAFQEALDEIEFIEIYSKNEQETENRDLIKE